MPQPLARDGRSGVAFLVAFYGVAEIIAMACSSPQTAEINIRQREQTLMKWVHIGQAVALVSLLIAAWIDEKDRHEILAGGLLAMVTVESLYMYARASGLAKPGPSTEQPPPGMAGGYGLVA